MNTQDKDILSILDKIVDVQNEILSILSQLSEDMSAK